MKRPASKSTVRLGKKLLKATVKPNKKEINWAKKRSADQRHYELGQHKLICQAVGCSPDASAGGATAYEAVCVLLLKLDAAKDYLIGKKSKEAKILLKYLKAHHDSETFSFLPLYGHAIDVKV